MGQLSGAGNERAALRCLQRQILVISMSCSQKANTLDVKELYVVAVQAFLGTAAYAIREEFGFGSSDRLAVLGLGWKRTGLGDICCQRPGHSVGPSMTQVSGIPKGPKSDMGSGRRVPAISPGDGVGRGSDLDDKKSSPAHSSPANRGTAG